MLYVIGRSVGQGRRAGIVSSLGVFVGCWVHILAAAFGIAALLRSSPVAFNVVRYAGRSVPDLSWDQDVGAESRSLFAAP
ncbi:MAG TPA: LysE family transporter [Candidatus Angelobacter sp.]|nr:LysE family transporter [Candidatus Angelobacter sp.]